MAKLRKPTDSSGRTGKTITASSFQMLKLTMTKVLSIRLSASRNLKPTMRNGSNITSLNTVLQNLPSSTRRLPRDS